ncbi:hypothetical protein DESC_960004 [Desulfosarcina cetonica]|nr:hypothetical protein DESC_960004 [Desulfosarcina cetonica]
MTQLHPFAINEIATKVVNLLPFGRIEIWIARQLAILPSFSPTLQTVPVYMIHSVTLGPKN